MKARVLLFLCAWLAVVVPGLAQNKAATEWPAEAERALDRLQREVEGWANDPPALEKISARYQEVLELRRRAEECGNAAAATLEATRLKIDALGAPVEGEARDVQQLREDFANERKRLEGQQGVCRLLALGGKELLDQIQLERQRAFSRELLTRSTPVWQIALASLRVLTGERSSDEPAERQLEFSTARFGVITGVTLAVLLPVALGVGGWLRRQHRRIEGAEPTGSAILARMFGARLPWITAVGSVAGGLAAGGANPLAAPLLGVMGSLALAPLLQLLVCSKNPRCPEGLPARILLGLVMFAVAALLVEVRSYLPEPIYLSVRGVFLVLLGLLSLWLLFALSRRPDFQNLHSLRLPLAVVLIVGPAADWLGYRTLGDLLVTGVYGTLAAAILAWLLYQAVIGGLDALDAGESHTAQRMRTFLGYKPTERIRGLIALRWLTILGLLLAFGYSLLLAWQLSEADTAALHDVVTGGFKVGAVTVVPSRLLGALLVFLLLLNLARWLRRQLDEHWLAGTRLDAGARQSIVTLTSYAIVAMGLLLSLSMAGLELSNLAIIAGALSVGIGFGLQNIVNNFVSGLILLFERPVRPGDWVIVGGTQGYVKKVSIRYTQIQTFERADVLVPNSELISNQVTNWMLNDPFGRVEVPVGVAYGSDTDKVRELLLTAAREHPLVMKDDPRVVPPRVYFMNFGDSSLNMELRCFIRQVDQRINVRSDLLFAIDKAFREADIEIPFPQRVVHQAVDAAAPQPSAPGTPTKP